MTETKFTAGPWSVYYEDGRPVTITAGKRSEHVPGKVGRRILRYFSFMLPSSAEAHANAHLIAAAPDLYEAAVLALNYITNTEGEFGVTFQSGDALRAALAKARGDAA